jgi:hypothetical protein
MIDVVSHLRLMLKFEGRQHEKTSFFHFQGLFMGNMKREIGGRQFVLAGFSFGDRLLLAKLTSLSMPHTHSNFIIIMISFMF